MKGRSISQYRINLFYQLNFAMRSSILQKIVSIKHYLLFSLCSVLNSSAFLWSSPSLTCDVRTHVKVRPAELEGKWHVTHRSTSYPQREVNCPKFPKQLFVPICRIANFSAAVESEGNDIALF